MRALLLIVLTLGCSSTSDKLRARFAKEKGCSADDLSDGSARAPGHKAN